ncbi:cell division protein FtsZ [Prolixibacter sp. SD074]|uniref:cell division protein FtsZ n=1 Tax=Prolixibacter sp. SD074 TaxID=2652391 RepID=UPI001276791C|nr:cell division protein FtsZ [Prolixibacter sp. SD074]GET30130.1 cell division protein FtsZ [Prolixibacter sp. SD074]
MAELMNFELPEKQNCIIKVIGVGGGGGNAVNHMFRQGIKDVDFAVCNTDAQALINSPVPTQVQLGASLTEGRGAGNKPDVGRDAARENIQEVEEILSHGTKMVFITAGMGGGTGTGAAPVIAEAARKLNLLTVGIVTIPFRNEGRRRIEQAIKGIREMEGNVDSLLIINNERIREMYGDFPISKAFSKADDVLAIAAKGIAEIITYHGFINVDFEDVKTVMKESGVAVMGSYRATGDERALRAVEGALNSPLLNNNDIRGARNILVNITSGEKHEVTMDEMNLINEYVQEKAGNSADLIYGVAIDPSLEDSISVTVIATGFKTSSIPELRTDKKEPAEKVSLRDEKEKMPYNISGQVGMSDDDMGVRKSGAPVFEGEPEDEFEPLYGPVPKEKHSGGNPTEEQRKQVMQVDFSTLSDEEVEKISNEPAYVRRMLRLENGKKKKASEISRFSLSDDKDEGPKLRRNNSFLHDKAD